MSNTIKFRKMQALGNDFVVIDTLSQSLNPAKFPIQKLSNHHTGIGFDQLLLIGSSDAADFSCRIFNADGGEAEQCGNGLRCVARYIHEKKLSDKKSLSIQTKAGIANITVHDFNHVEVNMGTPKFSPDAQLAIDDKTLSLSVISMGNPHAVMQVDSVKNFPVEKFGPLISTHKFFPQGVNVGFMEIVDRHHIRLRTYERGANETLACGSNSCASVVAGINMGLLDSPVTVELSLGNLSIEWLGNNSPVIMKGPAENVFDGTLNLSAS